MSGAHGLNNGQQPFNIQHYFESRGTLAKALYEIAADPEKFNQEVHERALKDTPGTREWLTRLERESARMQADIDAKRAAPVLCIQRIDATEHIIDALVNQPEESWENLTLDVIKTQLKLAHIGDLDKFVPERKEYVLDVILCTAKYKDLAANEEFTAHIRALILRGVLSSETFDENNILFNRNYNVESKAGLVGIYLNLDNAIDPFFQSDSKWFKPQETPGVSPWSPIVT